METIITKEGPVTLNPECSAVLDLADSFDYLIADVRLIDRSNKTFCCNFDGVTCNGSNVTGIKWNSKSLQGSIPASIGNISSLQVLDLSNNVLKGKIPSSIGNLKNLKSLYVEVSYR